MHPEQAQFEAAIRANWTDDTLRLIYADWLEEHAMPEEAARQRKWPETRTAAQEYMADMTRKLGGPESYDDYDDVHASPNMTVDELLAAATKHLDGGEWEDCTHMGTNENYKNLYGEFGKTGPFWDHYFVLTGRKVEGEKRDSFFSCSC